MRMIIAGSIPFLMLVLIFTGTVWMQKSKSPKAKQMATRFGMVKMDEMEKEIQQKSILIAYNVVLYALLGYTFYSQFVKHEMHPVTLTIAIAGILTQAFTTLILRYRSTKGDEDYQPYPIWKTLLWIACITVGLTAVGAFIVFTVRAW